MIINNDEVITELTSKLKQNNLIEGVCISGSTSRKLMDQYSDLDIIIYFKQKILNKLRQGNLFIDIPEKRSLYKGIYLDVKYYCIEFEKNRKLSYVEIWVRLNLKIVYEKNYVISNLLKKQLSNKKNSIFFINNVINNLKYNIQILKNNNYMKNNETILMFIIIKYTIILTNMINNKPIVYEKWEINTLNKLEWYPSLLKNLYNKNNSNSFTKEFTENIDNIYNRLQELIN